MRGRGDVADGLICSLLFVFASLRLFSLWMSQGREPARVLVEASVAQSAIERLEIGVLIRPAGVDQPRLHATDRFPGKQCLAAERLAIFATDRLRQAATVRQPVQHARHAMAGDGALQLDRDSLMRCVVHDHQARE